MGQTAKVGKKGKNNVNKKENKNKEAGSILKLKSGGVAKTNKRPISKGQKEANKKARMAIATGELASDEMNRRVERDQRTLYIRFKEERPADQDAIRSFHPDIQFVRIPRQAKKSLKYCFVEFGSEEKCVQAKEILDQNPDKYVDFVGGKSKMKTQNRKAQKAPINPTRLHVNGIVKGMSEQKLQQLFPKSTEAKIPKASLKKGTSYGFVQFANPADAKAAFDAAQKLNAGGHNITVLYARIGKRRSKENKKEEEAEESKDEVENDSDEEVENDDDSDGPEVENDKDSSEEEEAEEEEASDWEFWECVSIKSCAC